MLRLLHAADLHLSESEKDYGLGVLAELLEAARRERADFLLICGDLFDCFSDAERLRGEVRRLFESFGRSSGGDLAGGGGSDRGIVGGSGAGSGGTGDCEILFLPGNHEGLRRGTGDMGRLDYGPVTLLDVRPFQLLRRERRGISVEFLGIPHQDQYSAYGNWQVPAKAADWRVVLAHGVVAGMSYRGPDAEGGGSALDPDLFARFQADYAALGHIHGRRHQVSGASILAYPGSCRVWRKHESGPRGAYRVDLPAPGGARPGEPAFLPLASAGEYRHYVLPLSLEGEPPDLDREAAAWGPKDRVDLEFTGLVEDERVIARLDEGMRSRYGSRVRSLEVVRDGVAALPGISSHPVAREFLERWARRPEAASPDHPDRAAWLRARELALRHLKDRLEKAA